MSSAITVRIGTRGSPLALYQANLIASELARVSGGTVRGEIVTFTTKGDQLTSERLINSGGKGLFTREIDRAVDTGEIDLGVHSLKDVPSILPDGQSLIAFPEREDPRDGFLTSNGLSRLQDLPEGAVLGTASLRRESQALALRPDLKVIPFRGRVETRIEKLKRGEADATFLAMAGLKRLDLDHLAQPVAMGDMLPAAGQGIIAVAARPDSLREEVGAALAQIDHAATRAMVAAERAFLAELDGSCRTAMAAQLQNVDGTWRLRGEVLTPDGQTKWTAHGEALISAGLDDLSAMGRSVAEEIRQQAGGDLPVFTD
ncbi:MAG: hydroxymethylbilane synthase [Alphaproteobacteria bacterium]|nr:hydroxymethylbilane synthase [Alphaproteobacteria bacterium]